MLYIYLDFAKKQDNYKQDVLEKLSERYSFADYENEHDEYSIESIFDSICEEYKEHKIDFGLENEKLVCKCIDHNTDRVIKEREI